MKPCEVRRSELTRLRGSGGKRVSKIKNCFSVLCYNKKNANTTLSSSFRCASILIIFQLFLVLLVAQPFAWANLSSLSVDANGDSVFNGDTEKLQIIFTTGDSGDDDNQVYEYSVYVDYNGEKEIFSGTETNTGVRLSANQTVSLEWDGKLTGQENTLPDGDYTLGVRLTISVDDPSIEDQVSELETVVTIDTIAEKPDISLGDVEFSPVLNALPVYYTLDEDVAEALLVFQRAAGGEPIGQSIALNTASGSHTFNWNGQDANARVFEDGKYKLKIQVADNGGNQTESDLTEEITIDTEKPRITGLFINGTMPLVDGTYVNASVQTISFTADKGDGTNTELNLTGSDTEIVIKRVGGAIINGTLATSDNNRSTFTLGNPLNELTENGAYEATVYISDLAGNLASSSVRFTFDNAPPNLITVATNRGEFSPGSGVSGQVNYVEAALEDNFELNLDDSTIRLTDPNGNSLLGQQTSSSGDKIRWQLFSPLLAIDGLQDGRYTIEIIGADKAGNRTSPIPISFIYDNLAPELVSVKPTRDSEPFNVLGDTVYYNLPLNQFVVTFDDGEFGTGVIYSNADDISSVVFGTPNQDGSITPISGRAFQDSTNNVLTYILDAPLIKSDGSQDGNYTLNIKAADALGNFEIHKLEFIYDTQVPTLTSTVPAANQTVSNLTEVVIRLTETTSGIDFVQSTFSLKRGVGESEVEVPVDISSNGTDTATLTLLQPIASDGSDDGTYTIEVTPTDRTGNVGAAVRRQFYLVSQTQLQVRLITPETGTVNNLSDITAEITNYIGSGINFDASTITVMDTQGLLVPQAKVEADVTNNRLTWSTEAAIPRNGTADGEYSINVSFVDFSGQEFTQTFPLILDTQFPSINTVEVETDPKRQLSLDAVIDVSDSFSQITVEFVGTDTDFDNTVVTLTGPDENAIAVHRSNDGASLLTLNFQNLSILGTYTLTVTPSDNIGNVSETPFIFRFHLEIAVPVVTNVMIGGQSGAIVYVNGSAGEIVASLADTTGVGIAVGDGESSIVVTSSIGLPVPGTTTINAANQLIWRPVALPGDGSADGSYTVAVTPVDKAGRTGDVVYRAFIYDTQSPRLTAATPIVLHQPVSYIGAGLGQFNFTVEDVGPASLELDDQTIQLHNSAGETVSGYITHDDTNQLYFTLPTPLPTDGSADGEYSLTVHLIDKAGNTYQVEHDIVYDSQAPKLSSVSLNTDIPLSLTPYQVTDLSDSINQLTLNFVEMAQIDFANTIISIMGPDGSSIPITLENNGTDEITVNFVTLTRGGLYTLSVTPQDIAGNAAQGAVPYPFRLKFEVPSIASVKANSVDASFELITYQVTDITDAIISFTLEFTDAERVDFENTGVTLRGPDGQEVYVTLEDTEDDRLLVRFVPLTQSGEYTLSVTPQDIAGNVAPGSKQYPFRLKFEVPGLASVKANTPDASLDLIPYEIVEISESVNGFTLEFTDAERVDFANTSVVLMGPNSQEISVALEDNGEGKLLVRFVSLVQSGMYTLAVTPQDIAGNVAPGSVQYPFRLKFEVPSIASVKANTPDASLDLIPYEIVEISESVNGFTLEFTDAERVDFANTSVVLMGPNSQEISVALEDNGEGKLLVRFVSLVQSGMYTLAVTPQDIAGNVAPGSVQYPFRLKFEVPSIASVKANTPDASLDLIPYEIVEISESVNGFTLEFTDGARVDFVNTSVVLTGPNNQVVSVALEDDGEGRLLVRFVSLVQSGMYTLSVTLQDIAGNVAPSSVQYPFRLKFEVPSIASVKANIPDASLDLIPYEIVEISESVNGFTLEFTDGARVDFDNTSIVLTGPNGQEISVSSEDSGDGVMLVRFVSTGQSGLYTLAVTPQDITGNAAQTTVQYPFRLKFEVPSIASVKANIPDASLDLIPYEIVEISESVNGFTLEFTDGARVDFVNTSVVLTGPNGQAISVALEDDGEGRLLVRFVSLVQSGMYTLAVTLQDIEGNVAQGSVQYPFRLKFEVPSIASVKVDVDGTPIELMMHEIVEISETFSSLILEFTDASRIDFENTGITLTGPNGQDIAINLQDNDDSQLIVSFVTLVQSGVYTLTVTPQDKAGNVAQQSIRYQFRLDTTLPSVSSVLVDGKTGATVYVRNAIPRIVATITDSIGVGVAFGDNGSTIVVTNSQNVPVSGTTTSNGSNQLTWIPAPLPIDGTADGQYTVAVTPVDRAGRNGTTVHRQFIYDTQTPRIISATPLTLHAPVSYVSELSEFVLTIEDVGPAGLIFSSQVVALMDGAERPVPAVLTYDELTQQLFLTLTKPFASDGSADGSYTLNALLVDKAGNTLNSQFDLVYDSKVPQVSSVQVNTPGAPTELVINEVPDLSETIDTITIQFSEATRIDFENTSVSLTDPDALTIPLTQGDDGVSQLTLNFAELTKIGQYTLSVTPQDVAGNVVQSPIQFSFNLLFILPGVESVRIGDTVTLDSGDIAYVNADNLVIVVNLLDPAGVGLSFDSITGSDILVATLDNQIVPGRIATNETDVIAWSPATLSSDGSSDGRYAVYIYPVDKKGREGSTVYREFIYDTQEPEITDATPINLSQPVSYISESLTQFQFTVQDVGPADLILEDQEVSLRHQSGALIPTKLTNDTNNRIFLTLDEPLPLDGSRDGEYTVEIEFSDKSGNTLSINHPIVYDTQAPTLVSTVPAHGAQLTEDVTQIQVVLDDKGESGIDWSRTTVTLVDPNGVEISGELTSNGRTQMTLTTNHLVSDGMYIIRIQAVDRAGNGSQSIFERSFLLSRLLPAVLSTSPSTAPIEDAYTNEEVDQIEVMLETADNNHLSTVRLLNSNNQVISGQQLRQPDKLIYKLVRPLATDGSEDGIYTIEFTPISATGRSGEVQQLSFTYDTQPPELITKGVQLIVAEAQVNNSLTQIQLNLTDNVAGIDWENLDEDWVTFERQSPNPTEIVGSVSYVADEQSYIIFDLKVPLADDGSNDGKYRVTVTPIDKAGNGDETYEEEFTYDTSPPVIDPNSLLINDTPLLTDIDAEDYPSAISTPGGVTIQASVSDTGLGVNLTQSSISIRNPNGQEIPGTTRRNGVDTILFTSDGLNVEGNYQVMVTAVGNDTEQLGFSPNSSITVEFLYETTNPTAVVTNDGGKSEFTDEELTLEGTAADPQGVRRAGQQGENEIPVPASGVWLVEIVGTGPDGQPIEPVLATDESGAQQQPWSRWSIDFLPARSGEYDLDIRVTDKAGNYAVYDVGEYTMSVSFSFNGNTFVYPNPVRHSKGDNAFISFDLNAAAEEQVELTLYIYDWGGDLVYKNTYTNIIPGERNDTHINWKLKNQAGTPVARGLYVFRLEAVNGAGNRANSVGKILVVD